MIEFLIGSAAVYYTTLVITGYDGPNKIFYRLRESLPNSPLVCFVCLALWSSFLVYLVGRLTGSMEGFGAIHVFGMAGVATFAWELSGD